MEEDMPKVALILMLLVLAPAQTNAQQPSVPEGVKQALAKDLADLHMKLLAAGQPFPADTPMVGGLQVRITDDNVPVKAGASGWSKTLFTATQGDILQVTDKVDDWYAVAKPGPGGAPSTAGWVKAKSVVPIPAQGPGATPTGLIQSGVEAVFRIAVDGAVGLRDQYKNNPYVTIKGFWID